MPHGTIGAVGLSRVSAASPCRVAVVAPCPFPSLRGSQVLIRELAERLGDVGHAVHVVTYPSAEHLVPVRRIAIHRVAKIPGLWTTHPLGWQKLVLDLLLLWLLYRVVRRHRIQVIHAHNLEGPVIAYIVRWLTRVPVVYHAHNALTDELPCYAGSRLGRRTATAAGALLDRHIAAAADYSIALTDRLAAFLAVRGAAGRVTVVPPAVRTSRLADRSLPPKKQGSPEIMYAGNLDPYQDLKILVEGFERVRAAEPDARLTLITHASAHRRAIRRARALTGRPGVILRTVPTFAAAARELRRADVVVCPRGTWSGFPIKVLNYMAFGRPIVHARASAHPIEDGLTGLVFADDDPRALARAILRIVHDPDLAARLSRQARVVVRDRYSWSRVLPRILEVYGKVLVPAVRPPAGRARRQKEVSMEERVRSHFFATRTDTLSRHLMVVATSVLLSTLTSCSSKRPEAIAPLPPLGAPETVGLPEVSPLYRIQAYDTLRVKFLYHPELDTKVPVRPDGGVDISGVGEFQAAGKTTEQLAREVKTVSSDRLRDPEVEVIVAELGRYKVWVFGEVKSPGEVPFREGMTPLQAIGDRGGFSDYARADSVLRITPDGTATKVDLTGNLPDTITIVRANEVIYVPRTGVGDAVAFMRTFRNLLPIQPRFGIGYGID